MTFESPVSKGALKKLCGQLWYLSEELIAIAFFDRCVDVVEKRALVEGHSQEGEENPLKRISVDHSKISELRLRDFLTVNTCNFFKIFDLPDSILEVNPTPISTHSHSPVVWLTNPD